MKPVGSQTIITQRLRLRTVAMHDAEELVQAGALSMKLEEAHRAVAGMIEEATKPFRYHWTITLNDSAIGRIKAWDVDPYNGHLQLGYDIGPAYRNRGYMTEAVSAVVRFMFSEAAAHRVFCSVRASNIPSRRVCEKCGFCYEGTLRQHYARQDGGYDDVLIFGILRDEMEGGNRNGA